MEVGDFQGVTGIVSIPLLAWLFAGRGNRLNGARAVRLAGTGIAVQVVIAAVFLLVPQLTVFFTVVGDGVSALQAASNAGTRLVFGYLAGGPAPFEVTQPQNGFVLALQALPLILLIAVLSRLLYYFGILQRVVQAFAWGLQKTLGVGGALGTSAAANIFVGMVEAPLLVAPYIKSMSRSDLFAVMTVGMATVAGTVMALYASLLEPTLPGAAGHVLIASVMSAPAALVIARLMVPEEPAGDEPGPAATLAARPPSAMAAIAEGTSDGLRLLANVVAMLVVLVALVALANAVLGMAAMPLGLDLSVERLFGWAAAPLAWAIGIPWSEALAAGQLIGVKTVLNEFLAYLQLAAAAPETFSAHSRLILTYALCGFANPGSLGIMIGGLVAMAPDRRADILALGPRTLISGTLATLMTGAIAGLLG